MRKLIVLFSLLLGIVFLSGCGQQQIKQTQFTTTTPVVKDLATSTTSAINFLEENCELQDGGANIWECSGLYNYSGGPRKFEEDCVAIGYLFDCSGLCAVGRCYLLSSRNKTCLESEDCESGWCKPVDDDCTAGCSGSCSGSFPPDQCSSAEIFTFKAIERGEIVDKQAGGALCD
jgi:hypothetical protein